MEQTEKLALRKPQKKWHGTAIYRIKEVTSPIHQDFRGLRIQVAIPNMAGHKPFSSDPAPSFNKGYLLFQSSDYSSEDLQRQLPKHLTWLLNRGFEKIEPSEQYELRMLLEMAKSKGTAHTEREEI